MRTEHLKLHQIVNTLLFGKLLGEVVKKGDIICLDGDLGAGKTTLTQSLAAGLEVPPEFYITSPTFNIFHEYPGRIPLYHMDFYRLESSDDVIAMGLEEYFYMSGIVVIEWAERAQDILPTNSLFLHLKITNETSRIISLRYENDHWGERLQNITLEVSEKI